MKRAKQSFRASDLRRRNFFIDVSRPEPYVVQANQGKEFPLPALSTIELDLLRQLAAKQLRRGIVEDHDAVAEYRATLYYLNAWQERAASRQREPGDRSARSRNRSATSQASVRQPF